MKISRVVRTGLLAGVCAGLLSGCSWLEDWPPSGDKAQKQAVAPPPPQAGQRAEEKTAENGKGRKEAGKKADKEAANDASGATAVAAAAVQPAAGQPMDPESRIARLEQEMSSMRSDVGLMMPALTKLAESQGDIKQILANLESEYATNIEPAAGAPMPLTDAAADVRPAMSKQQDKASPASAPAPAPAAVKQDVSYSSGGAGAVDHVRVGEHPGKTRVVLDIAGDVKYDYDVDNNEKLLTLRMPGTAWHGQPEMKIINSPVVASYTAAPDGQGGTQMTIQLKKAAQVIWAQQLQASGGTGPRIVLDIAPL